MIGARIRANFRDLLGRFNDGLRFRVITDHDEPTVIRWHRLRRIRRADDREALRSKRKTEQDAEGERFHIAVLLCIIRAIEIPNSAAPAQWVNHRPIGRRERAERCNGRSLHPIWISKQRLRSLQEQQQSAACSNRRGYYGQKSSCPILCKPWPTFAFWITN